MNDNLGVYIHIPFCLRKCHYCDFLSFADADAHTHAAYVSALTNEIRHTPELHGACIDTVFIGGGTPSVLPPDLIARVLEALSCASSIEAGAEITLEANPATVTAETLTAYRRMGIDRLSFGLQSADDGALSRLGRLHTAGDLAQNFAAARAAGFANISIDLMFALPGQTPASWRDTLAYALSLAPEHISAYGLTIEGDTPFAQMLDEGTIVIDETLDREMYAAACEMLHAHGYARYEISNFAKPGFHSRHNMKYWTRAPYIGLGLGAHSFANGLRRRNTTRLDAYLASDGMPQAVRRDVAPVSQADAMAEFMFLGLRLRSGVDAAEFYQAFGLDMHTVYGETIRRHVADGTLAAKNGRVWLTARGVDVSNIVMGDFLQ